MKMKKMVRKTRQRYAYYVAAIATTVLLSGNAQAAADAKEVFNNVGGQFDGFGGTAIKVFAAVGIMLVGMGIWGVSTRKDNPQKPISHSIWFIVGGALLMALAVIIRIVLGSTIKAAPAGLSTIGIN